LKEQKMSNAWYEEVAAEERLTQGDLILNCPLFSWKDEAPQLNGTGETELLRTMANAIQADTVVMTQACDLEHEKVQNVVLCPHLSLDEYYEIWKAEMERREQKPSQKAWRSHCDDIREGFVWNMALLNSGKTDTLSTAHRVVDFRDIFTVPRDFLEPLLQKRGQPRLRLLPPYREHLSQAFARFFMRVGLPTPIEKTW
jgi:hypothetical protein